MYHNDADGDGKYDENWQLTKCTETLQNGITTEYDYQYEDKNDKIASKTVQKLAR